MSERKPMKRPQSRNRVVMPRRRVPLINQAISTPMLYRLLVNREPEILRLQRLLADANKLIGTLTEQAAGREATFQSKMADVQQMLSSRALKQFEVARFIARVETAVHGHMLGLAARTTEVTPSEAFELMQSLHELLRKQPSVF